MLGAFGPGFAEWAELVSMMFAEYQMKQRLFCVGPALAKSRPLCNAVISAHACLNVLLVYAT